MIIFSSSSWGIPRLFQDRGGYIIPSVCSGSTIRSPPSWVCPDELQGEAFRRHPSQMPEPPWLDPINAKEERLYSELPPESFCDYPKLMALGDVWNIDRPVNGELCLSAPLPLRHNARIAADAAPTRLSILRSIVPSLMNKTQRYPLKTRPLFSSREPWPQLILFPAPCLLLLMKPTELQS